MRRLRGNSINPLEKGGFTAFFISIIDNDFPIAINDQSQHFKPDIMNDPRNVSEGRAVVAAAKGSYVVVHTKVVKFTESALRALEEDSLNGLGTREKVAVLKKAL